MQIAAAHVRRAGAVGERASTRPGIQFQVQHGLRNVVHAAHRADHPAFFHDFAGVEQQGSGHLSVTDNAEIVPDLQREDAFIEQVRPADHLAIGHGQHFVSSLAVKVAAGVQAVAQGSGGVHRLWSMAAAGAEGARRLMVGLGGPETQGKDHGLI